MHDEGQHRQTDVLDELADDALPAGQPPASDTSEALGRGSEDETALAGTPVVVRRNAGLAALIGAAASGIAIAYLWRAVGTGAALDWALCGLLALIAGFYLAGLLDARTPLLVADDLGVRIRLGRQWRGLPWDAVASVEVQPRRGLARDGRLVFRPHRLERALEGLETPGRRSARLNQKLYGGALAVPLGLTTRASAGAEGIADGIALLARGRAEVTLLLPEPSDDATDAVETTAVAPAPDGADAAAAVAVPAAAPSSTSVLYDAHTPKALTSEVPPDPADPARPHRENLLTRLVLTLRTPRPGASSPAGPDPDMDEAPAWAGGPAELTQEDDAPEPGTTPPVERPVRPSLLGGIGTIVSRVAKGRSHDVDGSPLDDVPSRGAADAPEPVEVDPPAAAVAPLRSTRPASRAEVTRESPATTLGPAALRHDGSADDREVLPEGRELHRPGSVDLVFEAEGAGAVRPISRLGDAVEPLVIDDFQTEPAYDPVIGPDLAAARTRLGLTVDELADRTRIRPHVIESIEVDDFAPCGGDFYARGHLRTLARVLGQDPGPLLEKFDSRYANAPINARRVFEAELATGMTGSMRSTAGGPNWGLMIGAVLTLVLVWGVVRLFAAETPDLVQPPAPVLNGSAGVDAGAGPAGQGAVPDPVRVTLAAAEAGSHVVVRDAAGEVVFAGQLAPSSRKILKVAPPVTVRATNAGAVTVAVQGKQRGRVGPLGESARRTFHRPSA